MIVFWFKFTVFYFLKKCFNRDSFTKIKSKNLGDNIYVHGIAATPTLLLNGLTEHVKTNNLTNITLHHLHLEGETAWIAPDVKGLFF